MNLDRIKQLYNRRDRLQTMIDDNEESLLSLARKQIELERKAYFEVFPDRVNADQWVKWKGAEHLITRLYLRLSVEALQVETWWAGCRGGEDELQGAFTLDARMESVEGQTALYAAFLDKYRAMKGEQEQASRDSLVAQRATLEEQLRKLDESKK